MYKIFYHQSVWQEDFKGITKAAAQRIMGDIEKKLSEAPESYGQPLRYNLRGYFKLRIGEYRIVYRIEKKTVQVFVIKIGFRRNMEVYIQAARRLKK